MTDRRGTPSPAAPPLYSAEAEMSVLGAMLIDPACVGPALELVAEGDLYAHGHRSLYRAIAALHRRGLPAEIVVLTEELKAAGDFDAIGGVPYLSQLWDYVPTAANIEYHAKIVREKARQRRISEAGRQLASKPEDAGILTWAQSILADAERAGSGCAFPAPLSVRGLIGSPEPEEQWIVDGLFPMDGNLLIAGYPKSHKTNFILEAAVSATSATPLLARFEVPRRHRVGLVLMEDRPHRIRRRLQRICASHGCKLEDLDGWLFVWFSPPLRLGHAPTMRELARHVGACELDLLLLDNWSLVSDGNPDRAEEVTPQLHALSGLREIRPLTVGLVHHARKSSREKDGDGARLTDAMRGSGSFGAWYDAGMVLSRLSETSPVGVRAELRDHPSPEPFSFTVEDEFPAGPDTGRTYPGGFLRLRAGSANLEAADRNAHAEKFKGEVAAWINLHPGCSKADLERNISGKRDHVRAALDLLIEEGAARYDAPVRKGKPGGCFPTSGNLAPPRPNLAPGEPGDHLAHLAPPPLGWGEGEGRAHDGTAAEMGRGRGYPCVECGNFAFSTPDTRCFSCRKLAGEKASA